MYQWGLERRSDNIDNKAKWSFESEKLKIIIVYYRLVSPTPDSPEPLRSAPTPLRSYSGALRSAPEHINSVAPTLQTPLIHVVFPSSCVSHTSGALQPHAGALRSAPTPLRSYSGALRSTSILS